MSRQAYDRFCQQVPDVPLFMQPWYLDACCGQQGWLPLVVQRDHSVLAIWPLFVKRLGWWRYVTMPLHVKHMGPWLHPDLRQLKHTHAYYDALLDQLPPLAFFIQDFPPQVTNHLPFYWRGFRQTTRYTYVLRALRDADEVLARANRNVRRNIRKAAGLLTVTHAHDLATFYRLNRMSFQRQGREIYYSFDSLQRLDAALAARGQVRYFFAEDGQGRIHAASMLIWDRTRAWYHLAGEDPALRDSGAGILLTWHAIRHAIELGVPVFDFEGSMLPHVAPVRMAFGAEQEPYFRVWGYRSLPFALLHRLRGFSPW